MKLLVVFCLILLGMFIGRVNENNPLLSGVEELRELVKKGKNIDTLLGNDTKKLYYCKIGNFLSTDEKNAIIIYGNVIVKGSIYM